MSRRIGFSFILAGVLSWTGAGMALDYQRSGASQISRPLSGMKPSGLRAGHSFCNSIRYGPCVPGAGYFLSDTLQVTILSKPNEKDAADYVKPGHDLDTIDDLFAALRACWTPPPPEEASEGTEMSVRFSLKRDGGLIGPPRVTYITAGASAQTRDIYLNAITSSLNGCAPFALTKGLGNAIAGHPLMVRYVDNRMLKGGP